jgi:4-hydroxybenzoate polyprenyltransferase
MAFTDITRKNWMGHLPKAMHPYVYLMRLDRPIGWWLLLFPAWFGILMAAPDINAHTVFLMITFLIGAIIMRGAGCIINDLWDRDLDRQVERTAQRPLAAGDIDTQDALIFLSLLLGCGLMILLTLPWMTIFLGIFSLPLICLYPLMKRFTWWPQAFLGIVFNFGALMGWSAASGGSLSPLAFILYSACFFWTLAYDTVYAHQDRDDDRKVGIKSTALFFGDLAKSYVYAFYGTALFLMIFVIILSGAGFLSLLLTLPAIIYTIERLRRWRPSDQHSNLDFFRSNFEIGLLFVLALAL